MAIINCTHAAPPSAHPHLMLARSSFYQDLTHHAGVQSAPVVPVKSLTGRHINAPLQPCLFIWKSKMFVCKQRCQNMQLGVGGERAGGGCESCRVGPVEWCDSAGRTRPDTGSVLGQHSCSDWSDFCHPARPRFCTNASSKRCSPSTSATTAAQQFNPTTSDLPVSTYTCAHTV